MSSDEKRKPILISDPRSMMDTSSAMLQRIGSSLTGEPFPVRFAIDGKITPFTSTCAAIGVVDNGGSNYTVIPIYFVYSDRAHLQATAPDNVQVDLSLGEAGMFTLCGSKIQVNSIVGRVSEIVSRTPVARGTFLSVLTPPGMGDRPIAQESWEYACLLALMGCDSVYVSGSPYTPQGWKLSMVAQKAAYVKQIGVTLFVARDQLTDSERENVVGDIDSLGALFFKQNTSPANVITFQNPSGLFLQLLVMESAEKIKGGVKAIERSELMSSVQQDPQRLDNEWKLAVRNAEDRAEYVTDNKSGDESEARAEAVAGIDFSSFDYTKPFPSGKLNSWLGTYPNSANEKKQVNYAKMYAQTLQSVLKSWGLAPAARKLANSLIALKVAFVHAIPLDVAKQEAAAPKAGSGKGAVHIIPGPPETHANPFLGLPMRRKRASSPERPSSDAAPAARSTIQDAA